MLRLEAALTGTGLGRTGLALSQRLLHGLLRDTRVMNRQVGALAQQFCADGDGRTFAGVVGVGLEGEPKNGDRFVAQSAEQLPHDHASQALLRPVVHLHNRTPVVGHRRQPVMVGQVDQIEQILAEAAAAETRPRLEKMMAEPRIAADRLTHLVDIGTGLLADGGDAVDRTDALGQKRIGGQLGQLR